MGSAHLNDAPYEDAPAPMLVVPPSQNDEPVDSIGSPTASPADVSTGGRGGISRERPGGPAGTGGELQLVFTNVLLSVVGAYGVTGSVVITMSAAVIALLVTAVVARRR